MLEATRRSLGVPVTSRDVVLNPWTSTELEDKTVLLNVILPDTI
jgi:hypothetical protein